MNNLNESVTGNAKCYFKEDICNTKLMPFQDTVLVDRLNGVRLNGVFQSYHGDSSHYSCFPGFHQYKARL